MIASDGCEITHKLYYKHFKKEPSVKYCFVDKDTPKMYENIEGSTMQYYRGLPRQVARTIAEGYLHAYLDSDDFLMPNASKIIKELSPLINGSGGGQSFYATGGGTNINGIDSVIKESKKIISQI